MKGTIYFKIDNRQRDYAKCMEIIECMEKGKKWYDLLDSSIKVSLLKDHDISDARSVDKIKNLSISFRNDIDVKNYCILIEVLCNNETDIVNLQYFFLLRQWYLNTINKDKNCFGLMVECAITNPKESNEIYFKSSHFLINVNEKRLPFFGKYYSNQYNTQYLSFDVTKTLKKFSPLIYIESNTYEYWIQNFCADWKDKWIDIIPSCILNAEIQNASQKKRKLEDKVFLDKKKIEELNKIIKDNKNKKEDQKAKAEQNDNYRILLNCKNLICTKWISIARKRNDFCNSKEIFFSLIKKMSLFSFYILCLYIDHSSSKEEDLFIDENVEKLYALILKVRDLSDGFEQLMQNVIEHSEYKSGFCFIRIHDKKDSMYLQNKYGEYIKNSIEESKKNIYLEMQLSDYSRKTVPMTFTENLELRKNRYDSSDDFYKLYDRLIEKSRKLKLSSFFNPLKVEETTFWDEYYNIGENLVHHYGLQLFDSLISSNEGCFLASSTENYAVGCSKQCLYRSFAPETVLANEAYIPGTQYSILLPVKYTQQGQYTAVNADINYTSLLNKEFEVIPCEVSLITKRKNLYKNKEKIVTDLCYAYFGDERG